MISNPSQHLGLTSVVMKKSRYHLLKWPCLDLVSVVSNIERGEDCLYWSFDMKYSFQFTGSFVDVCANPPSMFAVSGPNVS